MYRQLKRKIKQILYGHKKFKKQGKNVLYDYRKSSFSYDRMEVGDDVFIATKAHFSGEVKIGKNVMFGPGVTIMGGDHLFGVVGKSVRFLKPQKNENNREIIIEDEVWCGSNVTILKGGNLGIGCVVGAGSIVTRPVPPFTIAVGNPAKCVRMIFTDKELMEHLSLLGYDSIFAKKIVNRRNSELEQLDRPKLSVYTNYNY